MRISDWSSDVCSSDLEYRIGEIYLSATPDNAQQISTNARKIIEQIQQGGSFQASDRQFSEASTAAVGGDLGWVRLEQVPPELAVAARDMQEDGRALGRDRGWSYE